MSNDTDVLRFPSSLSIERAKKRAKEDVKTGLHSNLTESLNTIAHKEMGLPWGKAIAKLKNQPISQIRQFMSRADIEIVMKEVPELTHFGFGVYRERGISSQEYFQKFETEKQSLMEAIDECNKACMYLKHLNKRKYINGNSSTYGLKHAVEHYMKRLDGVENYYVANGAFICAAYFMGFKIERGINASPNGFINYSQQSPIIKWRRLDDLGVVTKKNIRELEKLERDLGLPRSALVEQHSYLLQEAQVS